MDVDHVGLGGFAVCHWAVERATFEMDFTLSLEEKDREKLFDALDARGYTVPDEYRKGFTDRVKDFLAIVAIVAPRSPDSAARSFSAASRGSREGRPSRPAPGPGSRPSGAA